MASRSSNRLRLKNVALPHALQITKVWARRCCAHWLGGLLGTQMLICAVGYLSQPPELLLGQLPSFSTNLLLLPPFCSPTSEVLICFIDQATQIWQFSLVWTGWIRLNQTKSWIIKRTSIGEGGDNPLQYSCLENPMDRGAWRATVHGVARSRTRLKRLSTAHTWVILLFPPK